MRALSLFTGYGGIDLALNDYISEVIAYVEIEEYPQKIIAYRMADGSLKRAPIWNDVKTLNKKTLSELITFSERGEILSGKLKKLTEDQVKYSIEEYGRGASLADLAHVLGVSRQSMHDLLKRRIKLRDNKRFGEENHFYRGGSFSDLKAQKLMEDAIDKGILINPKVCSSCNYMGDFSDGRTAIQGHHDDYNKPLDVRWLCQKCHHEWHKTNTAIPKRGGPTETHAENIDIIYGGFP